MAFKIRRGLNQDRAGYVFAEGELIYTTDTQQLYVGDNVTAGGNLVSSAVTSVNGQIGPVTLTTADIAQAPGVNYFTDELAQDAVSSLFNTSATSNTSHSGITFAYNDSSNKIVATVNNIAEGDASIIGHIPYYDTAKTISYATNLEYNNGTSTLTLTNGSVGVTAGNTGRDFFTLTTNNSASASNSITMRKSRGTSGTPTAAQANDDIGYVGFDGYNGSTYDRVAVLSGRVDTVVGGQLAGIITLATNDNTGTLVARLRADSLGRVFIGPYYNNDLGSGALWVRGASDTSVGSNHVVNLRNISSATAGAGVKIAMSRLRGTYAAASATLAGDTLGIITVSGWDGVTGTPTSPTTKQSSAIEFLTEGPISSNIMPGSMLFKVGNNSGTLTTIGKFQNATTGNNGAFSVTGTINASLAMKTGVYADNAGRDAAITAPVAGMIILKGTTFQGYNGSTWVDLN